MKLSITSLAQQRFKAPVTVSFPTEQLDDKGQTVYGSAEFVGVFRCLPVEEAEKHLTELSKLRDTSDPLAAVKLNADQVNRFFIGFEAAPGKDMPFTDDQGQDLTSSPEAIKLLLNSKEVREAVQAAFYKAREADVLGKNSKR